MASLEQHLQGKYEVLEKLSAGGMGEVYKVRHRLLGEVQVVKVIHPGLGASPELGERFLQEGRAAIRLRHPNIAQLHDFSIADDGSAFLTMELIEGLTLEEAVRRSGPPGLGLGLEIGQQALTAIGFLHRRGFVHRDIAPDNLMLTRDVDGNPLVKLIDLGLAKVLAGGMGLTVPGTFLGKPRYAAPEQFSAEAAADARSDLYSFGVVLYELLTGKHPVTGSDLSSLVAAHLFRPPLDFAESDPEGRLPPDLREILLAALAKKPEERIASAEELARRLAAVQARFPVVPGELDRALSPPGDRSTPPPPVPPPALVPEAAPARPVPVAISPAPAAPAAPAEIPRNRWWLPAVLLVPLVLAGGAWLLLRRDRPEPSPPPAAADRPVEAAAGTGEQQPDPAPQTVETAVADVREAAPKKAEIPPAAPTPVPPEPEPKRPVSPPPAPPVSKPKDAENAAPPPPKKEKRAKEEASIPIVDSGPNVEDAEILSLPEVAYPEAARGSNAHPWIAVEVVIDETGAVVETRVVAGDKSGLGFNEAAREAALKARFKPATRNGVPVRTRAELTFKF